MRKRGKKKEKNYARYVRTQLYVLHYRAGSKIYIQGGEKKYETLVQNRASRYVQRLQVLVVTGASISSEYKQSRQEFLMPVPCFYIVCMYVCIVQFRTYWMRKFSMTHSPHHRASIVIQDFYILSIYKIEPTILTTKQRWHIHDQYLTHLPSRFIYQNFVIFSSQFHI